MIVQCENCKTKFNLDESLLKEEGSKVRCSVCGDVFIAYPPQQIEDITIEDVTEFEETVAIDTSVDVKTGLGQEVGEGSEPEEPFQQPSEEEPELEVEISSEDLQDYDPEAMRVTDEEESLTDVQEEEAEQEERPLTEPVSDEVEKEAIPAPKKKSKVGLIILLIVFVLVGAAAGIFYYAPHLIPESLSFLTLPKKTEIKDTGVRRLEFKGVTGSFVDSEVAGQLFVVRGTVVNNYGKPRSFILVKASVLDERGKVVKVVRAYAGNIFTEDQLKKLSYQDLVKGMKNRLGKENSNVNVPPGSSIPFMIVFKDLPQDLSEFTVEAVSSSPGA